MKGKMLSMVLCAAVVLGALVIPGDVQASEGDVVEIQFTHTAWVPEQLEILEKAIADFEAENPGIKIIETRSSWTDAPSQIMTSIVSGTAPDLIMCNPTMLAEYRGMGALTDLSGYISEEFMDTLLPIAKDMVTTEDGKIDGLPQEGCTYALFYRKDLFEEALFLYDKSVDLLLKTNAIFTYSGVLPEKINTFISYSFSIEPSGIEECAQMISELDNTFTYISTPFETDFNLAKAYFYEYKNQIDEAQKYLENALSLSVKLKIKNKEAKCRCFYSQFAYRQIINHKDDSKKWKQIGIAQLEQAINYYEKHTLSENNIFLEDCYLLMERFLNS